MCQRESRVFKKDTLLVRRLDGKLDLPIGVFGLNSSVMSVVKSAKKNNLIIRKAKTIFVPESVRGFFIQNFHFGKVLLTKGLERLVSQNGFIQQSIGNYTQKESPTSKPEDMRDKETLKVRIHLKNGRNLKENLGINVLIADLKSLLQKTTSNLSRWAEQTIFQISNLFVEVVIARSIQRLKTMITILPKEIIGVKGVREKWM